MLHAAEISPPEDPTDNNPIAHEEYWQGSNRLYICFGGVYGRLSLPAFEFSRSAGILDYSRIFLRDPNKAWFQLGLPGIGESIHDVARFLEQKIEASGARDVRFVGNCMGGHAALLLCALIGRGRAIAFVPQTFLSTEAQQRSGDYREPALLEAMYRHDRGQHIYDLRPWLLRNAPKLSADIYVATDHAEDLAHARDLEGFDNINIEYYERGKHRVLVEAHRKGLLPGIMAR